jgi:hypothetical protein
MTLIVAVATGNYAIHASDRYVSVQPTPKNKSGDWDLHANKTVVAIGSDCWVVIGYTGLAYLDGKPTDQLIAEAISGYDDLSDRAALIPWFVPQYPHYREIRDRIEQKIADAYSRLPEVTANQYATLVLASGVQRKDNKIYGVMFRITVQEKTSTAIELAPDRLPYNRFEINAVGMVNNDLIHSARERIIADAHSPEDVRNILMDTVTETSKLTDYVGDDIMGVVLDKGKDTVSTLFRAADPARQAQLLEQLANVPQEAKQMASVSTPYVLAPGMIYALSVGSPGGWASNTGIKFTFSGFDGQGGSGPAYVSGQPRKQPP